jgi:hypothetical protein
LSKSFEFLEVKMEDILIRLIDECNEAIADRYQDEFKTEMLRMRKYAFEDVLKIMRMENSKPSDNKAQSKISDCLKILNSIFEGTGNPRWKKKVNQAIQILSDVQ